MQSSAPKRFYKQAGILEVADGYGVALDGRAVKTPAGAEFRMPSRALAKAVSAEWAAQGERILPSAMPLTQFAFAAIDHTPGRRDELVRHVAKYGETDLCCHRASEPAALAARQAAAWDPLLGWVRSEFDLDLPVIVGVIAAKIDVATLDRLVHLARAQDDFRLTLLAHATGLAGSAIIGLALAHARIDGAQAYDAATVDEHWSIERWGEDDEARARLERMRAEFDTVAKFAAALA
ncbi:MAG: ATP12 family protein [Hyphomonadaceae bacterium]|nr:ATP12 family protein [Hyphomonadaceae bacterium]